MGDVPGPSEIAHTTLGGASPGASRRPSLPLHLGVPVAGYVGYASVRAQLTCFSGQRDWVSVLPEHGVHGSGVGWHDVGRERGGGYEKKGAGQEVVRGGWRQDAAAGRVQRMCVRGTMK
jgi:hypothetical protein